MSITCKPKQNVTMANNCGTFEVYLFGDRICATNSGETAIRIYMDLTAWLSNNQSLLG